MTTQPWPIVTRFLAALPRGAIGVDVGCGNGKNLIPRADVCILASDRSLQLARIAAAQLTRQQQHHFPHAVLVADALALPHRARSVDFALSVAVVHHLSTRARRVAALVEMLDTLKRRTGRAFVCVWALEQKGSRRGWAEGDEQDVMVPWVLKGANAQDDARSTTDAAATADMEEDAAARRRAERTFQRYYHLYREGELEEDVIEAGGVVEENGYERDNWWVVMAPRSGTNIP